MLSSAYIFRTHQVAHGLYDHFFGGLYFALGAPMMAQVALLVALPVTVLAATAQTLTGQKRYSWITVSGGLFCFALLCFFTTQPWDELFVNLRHAQNVARAGTFSFNLDTPIEGTVDFLPYLVIGLLGRLGLPIVELSFLQSGAGGILCILAACSLLSASGVGTAWNASFLFFTLFAPLVLNSSNGFAATPFCACILWSIYLLFFSKKKSGRGWWLLSILPLIRFEGIALVCALWCYSTLRARRAHHPVPWTAALSAAPWLLLCIWRWKTFHHLVPIPILYKSTTAGVFYVLVGLRNYLADLVNGYGLASVSLLFLCRLVKPNSETRIPNEAHWIPLLTLLAGFSYTYYISGGDWLPRYWSRYLLPFSMFAAITA